MTTTMLWFFVIVSWGSTVDTRHGFPDFEACDKAQQEAVSTAKRTVRLVTPCIGVPLDTQVKPNGTRS